MKTPAALTLLAVLGLAAHAQSPDVVAASKLQGEARVKALVDGARREGEVMVYHSTQSEDLRPVFEAFTQKYGVKVREWRSSSENVVQRIVSETRAGRHDVDFVENNSPEMQQLSAEKMLLAMDSPAFATMRPGTIAANREWATSTMDIFVQAYNTDKVKRDELPKSYRDFADPRWKGRLGIEAEDSAWYGTIVKEMGPGGARLFADIVAANGISPRKGHTLLANLVASGEIPLALTVYNYKPQQLKEKGAAIDWILLQPAVAQLHAVAVPAKATHPYAAMLLFDFFLGEGQELLAARHFVPSSTKVRSPFDNVPIKPIDAVEALRNQEAWTRQFDEAIVKRSGKP
jgi:iron(III) transport system substrate-binding protein